MADKTIPINWHYPEGLKSVYSTHVVVQHTDHEFYVSFFDAPPPIVMGSPEELQSKLESIEEISISCVARVVISPERMPELIAILENNYAHFLERAGAQKEEDVS